MVTRINTYEGTYGTTERLQKIVRYGCAEFSIDHLASVINFNKSNTNRKLRRVTFDSGVSMRAEQIQQILDYVKQEANTKEWDIKLNRY